MEGLLLTSDFEAQKSPVRPNFIVTEFSNHFSIKQLLRSDPDRYRGWSIFSIFLQNFFELIKGLSINVAVQYFVTGNGFHFMMAVSSAVGCTGPSLHPDIPPMTANTMAAIKLKTGFCAFMF